MTFSIVAYSAEEQAWACAVASKFPAVGAMVPFARANAGAVATQAFAKIAYGPDGLDLLAQGKTASETLAILLENDELRSNRQIGIVDAQGATAAFTGENCHSWAGHKSGKGYSVQGNILVGERVLDAMAQAYTTAQGELADRLIVALRAGESAGGDKRGKQSAAILVVSPNRGYGGDNDRYLDLRVDDHEEPTKRLQELVEMHHLYFRTPKAEDQVRIDAEIAQELQSIMVKHEYLAGEVNGDWDDICKHAFWILIGNENLEMRWSLQGDTDKIDRVALDYLRERLG